MRKFLKLFIFSIFITGECFSQEEPSFIFHLDSIPQQGVNLDQGWKFHTGDDPQWAKTEYDDNAWQPVNPTLQLHQLPMVKEAGVSWFRLTMKVDSSLLNERIAMVLTSHGATEIYLNGELLYKFGIVSSEFEVEQTRVISFRPLSLKLGNEPLQELAVRYSFHKKNLYLNNECIQLILKEITRLLLIMSGMKGYIKICGQYNYLFTCHWDSCYCFFSILTGFEKNICT